MWVHKQLGSLVVWDMYVPEFTPIVFDDDAVIRKVIPHLHVMTYSNGTFPRHQPTIIRD